jgi:hypothetical protein
MAIDLNKLIEDSKRAQAEAKTKAEDAKKTAEINKKDATRSAKYKQLNEYADRLRKSSIPFEAVIKRYATKIARGDKLDSLEQNELDNAIEQYNRLQDSISKAQLDAYNVYVGKGERPTPTPTPTPTPSPTPTPEPTQVPAQTSKPSKPSKPKAPVQGAMPELPTGGKPGQGAGITATSSFDPAAARIGEEVSMGATRPVGVPTGTKRDLQTLLAQTEFWYDLPDYIFNLDPKLGELLVEAVEKNLDPAEFLRRAKLTPWWQKNAEPVRKRIIAKAKFDELRSAGQDVGNTEYAMDTATIRRSIQAKARQMGAQLAEPQLEQIVSKVYNGLLENDELAIDSFIAPYIGKATSIVGTGLPGAGTKMTGFSGQALQNYQTLQGIAKANGLNLRDVLPGISAVTAGGDLESAVLQKLATGELDINRIAQDARMIAATGQPEYVRNLLGQGYDLQQIYAPYKSVMASVLELNPEEIDLKELSGYGLFSDKGESNIFDFKRALRKDSRWQYTEQARNEVADSVLGVLRDFGFQG